ncbi:hypothetical protein BDFB_009789 [Asbolus verrucosus]|uniref:7tm 6 domain containing protein n=1 Tax=Asbolus verrucosus TaxID=1661398 RepID=A0A482W050_ASBVE|nr:hypothetical protein BDFB_009789 [Asbolus verrucosus]
MYPYYKRPVDVLLKLFNFIGLNPLKKLSVSLIVFDSVLLFTILTLVCMQFTHNEMTIQIFADTLESLLTISQMTVKFVTLAVKRSEIESIIRQIGKFWNLNQFELNFRNWCLKQFGKVEFLVKILLTFYLGAEALFSIIPIISNRLVIICYIPEFIPRLLFVIFNNIIYVNLGCSVIAFDVFLLNQKIRMLKFEKVKTKIDEKTCLAEMKIVIEYHNFLYR